MTNVENRLPDITVLMSEYNTKQEYLVTAIESVLNQTYRNFEFLIIDDMTNSTNRELLEYYADKDDRIRIIHNEKNLGLTKSLNIGLKQSYGKYIARMDSDDICMPNRLELQLDYLKKHPDVYVLGGIALVDGTKKAALEPIYDTEVLKIRMIFYNCVMIHPTAFINKEKISESRIYYNESIKKSQDYMFWCDCILNGKIEILPNEVLRYRIHSAQISKVNSVEQKQCAMAVQSKLLNEYFDLTLNEDERLIHYNIVFGIIPRDINNLKSHFERLKAANNKTEYFSNKAFERECDFMWILMSLKAIKGYHDIRGLFSLNFFKAILHMDNWNYYILYLKRYKSK